MENQPVRDTANLSTKGTTLTLKHLKEMKGQIVDTNSNILNEKWCIAVRYGKCVEIFPIEPGIYYDLDQGVNLPLKE